MIRTLRLKLVLLFLLAATAHVSAADPLAAGNEQPNPLRIGMIGLDTSHVMAFTKSLNSDTPIAGLEGARVVAAFPGGSPDLPASADRVTGFTQGVSKLGVEIVDSIDALLEKVDVVLLMSVDGRPHLEQVRPVFKAGKPVFIDKPVAGSLKDAIEIFRLAKQSGVPCFSSSSLRYSPGTMAAKTDAKVGEIQGCLVYSPCSTEPHHPDLFWYGVHGVETVYAIMGTGCVSVVRSHTAGTDVVTGVWRDGRVATFRGIREGKSGYGATVFGDKGIASTDIAPKYDALLVEIVNFFRTGQAPVSADETIEIFTFMQAAEESKRQGGCSVLLSDTLNAAAKP